MALRGVKTFLRKLIGLRNDTDFYSQSGEDAILLTTAQQLLGGYKGYYLDIGAYHPFRHSNTYLLYRSGWSGVNVDPRPGSKTLFDRFRPRDLNIEAGVGAVDALMTYYWISENSTMNTFDRGNLERLGLAEKIQREIPVPVFSFSSLISKFGVRTSIDYLNIDAEGFEMEILQGIPFEMISPRIIALEQNGVFSLKDVLDSPVTRFLEAKGYVPYAKNFILKSVATVFYCHVGVLNPESEIKIK